MAMVSQCATHRFSGKQKEPKDHLSKWTGLNQAIGDSWRIEICIRQRIPFSYTVFFVKISYVMVSKEQDGNLFCCAVSVWLNVPTPRSAGRCWVSGKRQRKRALPWIVPAAEKPGPPGTRRCWTSSAGWWSHWTRLQCLGFCGSKTYI